VSDNESELDNACSQSGEESAQVNADNHQQVSKDSTSSEEQPWDRIFEAKDIESDMASETPLENEDAKPNDVVNTTHEVNAKAQSVNHSKIKLTKLKYWIDDFLMVVKVNKFKAKMQMLLQPLLSCQHE